MSVRALILMGAGGHGKVLMDLATQAGWDVVGVCDPQLADQGVSAWRGVPVIGKDDALSDYRPELYGLINGLGSLPGQDRRRALFQRLTAQGYSFPTLVHPTAVVGDGVELEAGVQVMAGVVLQADVVVGLNSIVNTRASLDHDCRIGAHCHIAPAAVLCGSVVLGEGTHVGAGANVIQGISVGEGAVIGAGTTVLRDVAAWHKLVGRRNAVRIGERQ